MVIIDSGWMKQQHTWVADSSRSYHASAEQAEGFMEEGGIDCVVAAVHATNVITEVWLFIINGYMSSPVGAGLTPPIRFLSLE